jgi:hypothetical protein
MTAMAFGELRRQPYYCPTADKIPPADECLMGSEIMRQIIQTIEDDVAARPSAIEFEMAYQVRVAIDRIKFAIRHADQFGKPSDAMREAGMQLLDGLQRLETVDRRFQTRSRMAESHNNENSRERRATVARGCR